MPAPTEQRGGLVQPMALSQEGLHFSIANLSEVSVPIGHGEKGLGRRETHKTVYLPAQTVTGLHEAPNMTDSRHHGASRGKAIVDDNYRFAIKIQRRAACAIEVFAPSHLSLFARDGVLDILIGNSQLPNHLVIQNPRPARDSRP
jgi:hypothetical protein